MNSYLRGLCELIFLSSIAVFELSWAGFPKMIINEKVWPPYYVDQYDFWGIYQIPLPKPSSPVAYCAILESVMGKMIFRTEGEAKFDGDVTAVGPMCHEFDDRGNSYGGTGLALVTPSNYDPFRNLGNDCSPLINNGSNPINAANGNKYQHEIDYWSDIGLSFSRHYNSLSGGASFDAIDNKKVWTANYDSSVRLQTTTGSISFGNVHVYRSNGNINIYKPDGNGYYIPENTDNLDKLEYLGSNGWRLLIDNNNSIENYSSSGKLLSVTRRDGRTQILAYDADGRLITVTDDIGRALSFTYDSKNRIQTLTDPNGGLFQYVHDTNNNLLSVTYPDGRIRTYHYNEQIYTNNTHLPNALTGITDENGARNAIYRYDASGRAIVSEHAGETLRYSFKYTLIAPHTIVDPIGTSIHKFNLYQVQPKASINHNRRVRMRRSVEPLATMRMAIQ